MQQAQAASSLTAARKDATGAYGNTYTPNCLSISSSVYLFVCDCPSVCLCLSVCIHRQTFYLFILLTTSQTQSQKSKVQYSHRTISFEMKPVVSQACAKRATFLLSPIRRYNSTEALSILSIHLFLCCEFFSRSKKVKARHKFSK